MFGPKCQSCGMPLQKDQQGGGTNADGSRSQEYCSQCYEGGGFTDTDLSCEQMMAKVSGKLREVKFPGFLASLYVNQIPQLRRWATNV